jgi:signal transduction histidine kinase
MKLNFVKKIISPPVFEDEEKTRVAGVYNWIALASSSILTAMIILRFATGTMDWFHFAVTMTCNIVNLILWVMMRRGIVKLAISIYSIVLFLGVTSAVYIDGGVNSSITGFYVFCIVTASLLVGNRAGILMMILSSLAVFGFVQADSANLIPFAKEVSGIAHLLIFTSVFISVGVVQMIAVRSIKQSLEETRESERKLMLSNQDLEHFAYISTHDLQEPLRKIQAFGERLQNGYMDKLDTRGSDYLVRMLEASRRSQSLVEDLLVYSRISTAGDNFELVKLNKIIEKVLADLQDKIDNSGARVTVGILSTITANPTHMHQLLYHLIDNAIKFRSLDIPLEVRINTEGKNQEGIVLTVSDNGIGFEEQYLDKIFQPFQRLHGRQEYAGSGIGLAVCKKIVVHHGGSITATSQSGKGSKFTITFPPQNLEKSV